MKESKELDLEADFAPKARQIRSLYKVIKIGFFVLSVLCISPLLFELIETPPYLQLGLIGGGMIASLILISPAIWIRYFTKCPNCAGRIYLDEARAFQCTGKCGFCGSKLHESGDVTGWDKYFK